MNYIKRLKIDTKIGIVLLAVALMMVLANCGSVQIVKPGPPELADLAWSVAETAVVFLPAEYREDWMEWKPEVEEIRAMLEEDKPISGEWVKEKFLEKLTIIMMGVLDESDELTDIEKQVLVDDFNRAFKLVAVEGEFTLTPDQRTIIYGAVRGVLSGFARFDQDPLGAKIELRDALKGRAE